MIKPNMKFEADVFDQASWPIGTSTPCLRIWAVDGDKREAIMFQPIRDMMPSRKEFVVGKS